MYTEYVFVNKKYEVAQDKIRAILYEIISSEESKIADLRDKAFVDATDPKYAADLQSLYVQQDSYLRDILAIGEKLSNSLQKADSCSRKLEQIIAKENAQILESVNNMIQPTMGMNYENASGVEYNSPIVEEPIVDVSQNVNETPMVSSTYEDTSNVSSENQEVVHEVIDEPVPQDSVEEPQITSTEIVDDSLNSASEQEVVEKDPPKEEIIHEVLDTPDTEEEPQITATEEATVLENNSSENLVSETTDAPAIISTEDVSENTPVEVNNSEPVIVTEIDSGSTSETDNVTSEPIIAVTSEEPVETEKESSALIDSESASEVIPTISQPVIPVSDSDQTTDKLVFHKRTDDIPKVIMISGKQAIKLRQSLSTKEALLRAKGYFKEGLEQTLVDNGLLAPSVENKQAQIETMMNQANQLYADGKVEEAQKMYDQISALNQELQTENAGGQKTYEYSSIQ